jgi:hypothetical protein
VDGTVITGGPEVTGDTDAQASTKTRNAKNKPQTPPRKRVLNKAKKGENVIKNLFLLPSLCAPLRFKILNFLTVVVNLHPSGY